MFDIGGVNQVRVRRDDGEGSPYSAPVTLIIDPLTTFASENQLRVLAIDRKEDQITFRWRLGDINGKETHPYFEYVKEGEPIIESLGDFPPQAVEAFVEISEQSLSVPCGVFWALQSLSGLFSGPSVSASLPGTSALSTLEPSRPACEETPAPAPAYVFSDAYHHRDHLGNLRVVTDGAGNKVSGHDYYPYGFENTTDRSGGSRRRFTGHERDEATVLDYMMGRVHASAQQAS